MRLSFGIRIGAAILALAGVPAELQLHQWWLAILCLAIGVGALIAAVRLLGQREAR